VSKILDITSEPDLADDQRARAEHPPFPDRRTRPAWFPADASAFKEAAVRRVLAGE